MEFKPVFFKNNFEDNLVKKQVETIFKQKRGYVFKMPSKNTPVILVVSGGLDSIMLWFNLLNKYKLRVYPIHFVNGYANFGERLAVFYFYKYFKKRFPLLVNPVKYVPVRFNLSINSIAFRKLIKNNSSILINNLFFYKETKKTGLLIAHHPLRLFYYITGAYEYGLNLQTKKILVHTIFTGFVTDDLTIRESTLSVLRSLNLYLCLLLGDWQWQVEIPLDKNEKFFSSKTVGLKIAKKEGIPIKKTWSCHYYFFIHCGFCNGCKNRKLAFKYAHIKDETAYLFSEKTYQKIRQVFGKILFNKNKSNYIKRTIVGNEFEMENIVSLLPDINDYGRNNQYFLINNKTGEIININNTAYYIYKLVRRYRALTIRQIIYKIRDKYSKNHIKNVERDIILFIKKLNQRSFVKISYRERGPRQKD